MVAVSDNVRYLVSTLRETIPSPKVGNRCIVMGSEAESEASKEATSANPTAARTEDGGSGENKATGVTYITPYEQLYTTMYVTLRLTSIIIRCCEFVDYDERRRMA